MDIYNMITSIPDYFLLLILFGFATAAIIGGLLNVGVTADEYQQGEHRQAIILEGILSLKASQEELATTASNPYEYTRQKAVLPIEYFTNQDPAEGEIGFQQSNGNCYIEGVSGLDGENYAFSIQVVDSGEDVTELECAPESGRTDTIQGDAVLIRESSDNPRLRATISVYSIDTTGSGGSGLPSSAPPGGVGGGAEYPNKVCSPPSGTQTVSSVSGLESALSGASSGDTVYVQSGANLDMTGETFEVPSGVTLASSRGCGGSEAATLTDNEGSEDDPILNVASDARVTGLNFAGFGSRDEPEDRDETRGVAIRIEGDNAEVDNNRIDNFVGRCVISSGNSVHFHHNTVTYCNKLGYGYLIHVISGQDVLIESNYFNHYRHAIAGSGGDSTSYVARFNVVGPARQNHDFDFHGDEDSGDAGTAGRYVQIYRNTFQGERTYTDSGQPHIDIRGMPAEDSVIRQNWFEGMGDEEEERAITILEDIYTDGDNPGTITIENNHYGSSEPSCDIGAPREGCESETSNNNSNSDNMGSAPAP